MHVSIRTFGLRTSDVLVVFNFPRTKAYTIYNIYIIYSIENNIIQNYPFLFLYPFFRCPVPPNLPLVPKNFRKTSEVRSPNVRIENAKNRRFVFVLFSLIRNFHPRWRFSHLNTQRNRPYCVMVISPMGLNYTVEPTLLCNFTQRFASHTPTFKLHSGTDPTVYFHACNARLVNLCGRRTSQRIKASVSFHRGIELVRACRRNNIGIGISRCAEVSGLGSTLDWPNPNACVDIING